MLETSRTGNAVTTKWRSLVNNPKELVENKGKVLWPMGCCWAPRILLEAR